MHKLATLAGQTHAKQARTLSKLLLLPVVTVLATSSVYDRNY